MFNGIGQLAQNLVGSLPAYAAIGDRNTVFQTLFALRWDVLLTFVDVGLDHDTDDLVFTVGNLFANNIVHLGLVSVVLVGVTVRAVDHQGATWRQLSLGLSHGLSVVVGALLTTSQNHEAVLVTLGSDNGSKTVLGNTHEVMGVGGRKHGVDGHTQSTVGTVLEADWERQTRSQLSVQLGLGGSGANSTE